MPFVTIKTSFAARTQLCGRGIAHEATALGHREGSTGVRRKGHGGNDDASVRGGRLRPKGDTCSLRRRVGGHFLSISSAGKQIYASYDLGLDLRLLLWWARIRS